MRWFLTTILGWLLVSCSHGPRLADPIQTIADHPRLVYRSLDPLVLNVAECPSSDPLVENRREALFIPFPADRWNLPHGDTSWRAVYQRLDESKPYALIGRARPDEAGAALVAQRRANVVAQLLTDAGFPPERLQLLASWGRPSDGEAQRQGVFIVQVPSAGGLWGLPQTVHHSQRRTHKGG